MTADFDLDDDGPDELIDARLAEAEAAWDGDLRSSLVELLAIPDDLAERTTAGVREALLTRSTLAAGIDLLSVGWHTLRLLAGADSATEAPR